MSAPEMFRPPLPGENEYWKQKLMNRENEKERRKALSPSARAAENAAETAKRAAKEQLKKNKENAKLIPELKILEKSRHIDFKYIEDYKEGNHNWNLFVAPDRAEYAFQIVTLSDLIRSFINNATIKMDTKSGWLTSSKKIIITRKDGLKLAFKSIRDNRKLEELYEALNALGIDEVTSTSGGYKSRSRIRHKKRTATRRTRATKSR